MHWVASSGRLREIEEERLIREKRGRVNFYIILFVVNSIILMG